MSNFLGMAGKLWSSNAACEHCFNWRKVQNPGNRELSLVKIEKLTKKLPPMLLVNLCGGEPTMRTDLPEIVSLFTKNTGAEYITIPTNAFLPSMLESQVASDIRNYPKSCVCTWECTINMSFLYQPIQSMMVAARAFTNFFHAKR